MVYFKLYESQLPTVETCGEAEAGCIQPAGGAGPCSQLILLLAVTRVYAHGPGQDKVTSRSLQRVRVLNPPFPSV